MEADVVEITNFLRSTCGLSTSTSKVASPFLVTKNKLETVKKLERQPVVQFRDLLLSCPGMTAEDVEMILEVTHKSSPVTAATTSPVTVSLPALAIGGAVAIQPSVQVATSSSLLRLPEIVLPIQKRQIMISYNWDHKIFAQAMHKHLAIALGYDVWIDEIGSSLVPKMIGSSDQRMAEAVEASEFVMMLVSPQYFLSAACEKEAQYASARRKKLVFIMLDPTYTTVSSPNFVGGWLGLMIGTQIWYPCFNVADAPALANKLAVDVFKDSCKL